MNKKICESVLKAISKTALHSAKSAANSTCFFVAYQPKEPQSVKKLRKF